MPHNHPPPTTDAVPPGTTELAVPVTTNTGLIPREPTNNEIVAEIGSPIAMWHLASWLLALGAVVALLFVPETSTVPIRIAIVLLTAGLTWGIGDARARIDYSSKRKQAVARLREKFQADLTSLEISACALDAELKRLKTATEAAAAGFTQEREATRVQVNLSARDELSRYFDAALRCKVRDARKMFHAITDALVKLDQRSDPDMYKLALEKHATRIREVIEKLSEMHPVSDSELAWAEDLSPAELDPGEEEHIRLARLRASWSGTVRRG